MPNNRKFRKSAISAFQIPSGGEAITLKQWNAIGPDAVWYGMPVEGRYALPNGRTYARCHVEAFDGEHQSLGYIPLPHRYAAAWVQLCYSVVYWMTMWKAWMEELGRGPRVRQQPDNLVQVCVNNSATRFLKYQLIRRLVTEELLRHPMSPKEDDECDIFDEYLIRDRFDWLWTDINEIPEREVDYLLLDPVHESNKATFSWSNPKLLVPHQMMVPKMTPTHTWMWGQINHFDFQAYFAAQFPALASFYQSEQRKRCHLDTPYDPNARELPARWHESHEPAVDFLTKEEDMVFKVAGIRVNIPFMQEQEQHAAGESAAAGPSSAAKPQESGPLERHAGVAIDCPESRAVVQSFLQVEGGINLAQAHERLQQLFGGGYNAEVWGKLIDSIQSEPGGEPLMTVDEAFQFYGPEDLGRVSNTAQERPSNLRKVRASFY